MFEVCRVLFLEDYEFIREHYVKEILSIDAKSFVFHGVATYEEAIEVAKKTKIDIFIL